MRIDWARVEAQESGTLLTKQGHPLTPEQVAERQELLRRAAIIEGIQRKYKDKPWLAVSEIEYEQRGWRNAGIWR